MGKFDFAGLKLKLVASIVAISGIHMETAINCPMRVPLFAAGVALIWPNSVYIEIAGQSASSASECYPRPPRSKDW